MRSLLLSPVRLAAVAVILAGGALLSPASAQPAALDGVPCNRLAEAVAAYHEQSLELDAMTVGFGGTPDPRVAAFGERLKPVLVYMKARKLQPRKATEAEPALYRSGGIDMLNAFERRCALPGAGSRPRS